MISPSFIDENSDALLVTINVHSSSSQKKIVISDHSFDVYVREPPDKGKANKAVLKLISKEFTVPSSYLTLVKGHRSKTKIISINKEKIEYFKNKILEKIV